MKKIIFALVAVFAMSTFAFANHDGAEHHHKGKHMVKKSKKTKHDPSNGTTETTTEETSKHMSEGAEAAPATGEHHE